LAFTDVLKHSKPRIVFLNRCYWPDTEATGQLLSDLCENLVDEFDVHVVCGQPNSPSTDEFLRRGIEERAGVTIHRLEHTRFRKRIPAGRLLNLISFSHAAGHYLRRSRLAADIVVSETDPFLLPLVAVTYAESVGASLVCYLQDIYPDVAEAIGKVRSGWLTSQVRRRLRDVYQKADRVVVLGECMRRRLESFPWSISADRIRVIPNWADCRSIEPRPAETSTLRQREGLAKAFVVMHSGNMGLTQRLNVLVQATNSIYWPDTAVLLLIGDGAARESLQSQAAALESKRVRFLPYQPRQDLADSLSAADLHVVSMDERIAGCLCPSKLYGILAAGRPILAIASKDTDLARVVTERKLGWYCAPGEADEVAKLVARASAEKSDRAIAGGNARRLASQNFDFPVVVNQFKLMLTEIVDEVSAFPQMPECDSLRPTAMVPSWLL
jgi:glycosyltransferase involved in cell wall biosynthesis